MIPESKLKEQCPPEIIKRMVELAEGFHISERYIYPLVKSTCINYNGWCAETTENFIDTVFSFALFPLLIHRAVEGWNRKHTDGLESITIDTEMVNIIINQYPMPDFKAWHYKNYQPSSLTPCECACLHCLIEVLG